MKLSPLFCASFVALAALALSASGASAANLNLSKSNINKLAPNDPNAEKACTDGGGIVSTDKDGQKICTQPEAANATTVKSSKSNSQD